MPNTQVNDGSVVYGSRQLSITTINYVADDFTLTPSFTEVVRTDQNDKPSGRMTVKGPRKGSATLQLATTSTTFPDFGAQFTETIDGTSTVFTIQSVGLTQTKNGEAKLPIEFVENITSSVVIT